MGCSQSSSTYCTECIIVGNDREAGVVEHMLTSRRSDDRLEGLVLRLDDEGLRPPQAGLHGLEMPEMPEVQRLADLRRRGPATAAAEQKEEEAALHALLRSLPPSAAVGQPALLRNLTQDLADGPEPDVQGAEVFRIFTPQHSQDGCSQASADRATMDTDMLDTSLQELSDSADDVPGDSEGLQDRQPAADVAQSLRAREADEAAAAEQPEAKRPKVEPAEVEPAELEPAEVEPAEVEPAEVGLAEVGPAEVPREAWHDFLARSGERVRAAGVADEAAALLECFQTTPDVGLTFAAFARLFLLAAPPAAGQQQAAPWASGAAGARPWRFPYQAIGQLPAGGGWKAQKLWKLLDDRAARPEYAEAACSRGRLRGKRCLVVGAGPCGLRAAIELRLLGAEVVLTEQRCDFSRINQLHIWSWCGEDLKGLGARLIEPPPKDFGANPDLLVISISDLQKLLLKVALLVGVDVRMGVEYDSMSRAPGGWQATIRPANVQSVEGRAGEACRTPRGAGRMPPSPLCPGEVPDVSVLIGSGGFASSLGEEMGMRTLETESLRKESAIGLVCNIARTHGKGESKLRSFSMARQFYARLFQQLREKTGLDLENIVYVKAAAAHYFVMTPTPKSLVETGVARDAACRPLLSPDNIDQERLAELVRSVASYELKEGEPAVLEAVTSDAGRFPGWADSGPRLFDFSKMRRSQDGLLFLPPGEGREEEESLLVALVGDALMEPFWPEGLGIMRGFFGALDACHAVRRWSDGATALETQEQYQKCYQQLKTLSAATRANVLRPDERSYALEPSSRYR